MHEEHIQYPEYVDDKRQGARGLLQKLGASRERSSCGY